MQKKLLLHTCCAPCLTQCLSVLTGADSWNQILPHQPGFSITLLFDNPNIYPEEEFKRRKGAVLKLVKIYQEQENSIEIIADSSEERRIYWNKIAAPLKDEPEKGKRCAFCYEMRLEETFKKAKELEFDTVATTLTLSPWKDAGKINAIGKRLSLQYGVEYLESDFKKNNGFKKSIALSLKCQLYRQNYCGCLYSLR
jgi:predicted adenine nucleotide alpha hydrolase (AANH) superfamily ATPase